MIKVANGALVIMLVLIIGMAFVYILVTTHMISKPLDAILFMFMFYLLYYAVETNRQLRPKGPILLLRVSMVLTIIMAALCIISIITLEQVMQGKNLHLEYHILNKITLMMIPLVMTLYLKIIRKNTRI